MEVMFEAADTLDDGWSPGHAPSVSQPLQISIDSSQNATILNHRDEVSAQIQHEFGPKTQLNPGALYSYWKYGFGLGTTGSKVCSINVLGFSLLDNCLPQS
jgi:hypothetical protein